MNSTFQRVWLLVAGLALCSQLSAEPRLWGHLRSGSYAVGFRIVQINQRADELHVWYPSVADQGSRITLGHYLQLSHDLKGAEPGCEHNEAALLKTLQVAVTGSDTTENTKLDEKILAMPLAAVPNAAPASGRFPLIFWTQRYATTVGQS